MLAFITGLLTVPMADQLVKYGLRRSLGSGSIPLGPIGAVRLVDSRIWLARGRLRPRNRVLWTIWAFGGLVLLGVTLWSPSYGLSAGLLLGGAASHAFETTWRGGVCDYICLRFWPAFNLADVAITVGGLGIAATAFCMTASGDSMVSLPGADASESFDRSTVLSLLGEAG